MNRSHVFLLALLCQLPYAQAATARPATAAASASSAASTASVPNTIAQRARACTHCHQPRDTQVADQYFPRIAGKPARYLQNQMHYFLEGQRRHPQMQHMLNNLPDNYLAELATFFAGQSPQYVNSPTPIAPEQAERGAQLALKGRGELPACTACHGADLRGRAPAIPGLLGLPRAYLTAQLGAWKNGSRRAQEPDCMAQVVRQLSDEDISALTAWLALQNASKPEKSAAAVRPLPLRCGVQEDK